MNTISKHLEKLLYSNIVRNSKKEKKSYRIYFWFLIYVLIYIILLVKFLTLKEYQSDLFIAIYSIGVTSYILIRFLLSFFYEPDENKLAKKYMPKVTFAVPAKNEESNIEKTLMAIANTDYPKDMFEIIAVNDGSTDNTLKMMEKAKYYAAEMGVKIEIFNWKRNRGKRAGMAKSIKSANGEIIVFVDSDSFVQPNTLKELLKYFVDKEVAIVTAHSDVYNGEKNFLTKIQQIHYYISFNVFKSTESLFGAVTCCPGCCSAYRKEVIINEVKGFLDQCFLGAKCTYGDDRSLTNTVLKKGYKSVFAPTAIAYTIAPDNFNQFFKQQLRWKKSWTKESLRALKYFWKKNPIISFVFYLGFSLTIISPLIVFRALVWYPIYYHTFPVYYIFGLLIMSSIFAIYYKIYTNDRYWFFGILYSLFYSLLLNWQLPYALLTLKDPKWGTR